MVHDGIGAEGDHVFHGCHDLHDGFRVQLQNTIQNANLVIAQWLFAMSVKLEERFEFRLLVCVPLVSAKNIVKELSDGPSDGGYCTEKNLQILHDSYQINRLTEQIHETEYEY